MIFDAPFFFLLLYSVTKCNKGEIVDVDLEKSVSKSKYFKGKAVCRSVERKGRPKILLRLFGVKSGNKTWWRDKLLGWKP